jgi:hypothetical protein
MTDLIGLDDIPPIPCRCSDPEACEAAGKCVDDWVHLDDLNEIPDVAIGADDLPGTIRADHVTMRSIEFLDKPFLQRSAFHLFAGPKGVGKGTKLAGIAADFTLGAYGDNRNVIYVSSEDSMEVDTVPVSMPQTPILRASRSSRGRSSCPKTSVGYAISPTRSGTSGSSSSTRSATTSAVSTPTKKGSSATPSGI